jgi:hypothetical protein
MKLLMSSQRRALFTTLLDWSWPWGLKAKYKKKNSVLVGQTAHNTMAGSGWHSNRGSSVDLGPLHCCQTTLLSFNWTKSRAVTGLLTSYNALRRHLHIMELTDSPLCRKCGAEEETSTHVL